MSTGGGMMRQSSADFCDKGKNVYKIIEISTCFQYKRKSMGEI